MVVSTLKSSARGNPSNRSSAKILADKENLRDSSTSNLPTNLLHRRSRSVSSFASTPHLDVSSEFLIKRDNPLFWSDPVELDEFIPCKQAELPDDSRTYLPTTGRGSHSVSQYPVEREDKHEINSPSMHKIRSSSDTRNVASNCDTRKKSSMVRSSSDTFDKLTSPRFRSSLSPLKVPHHEDRVSISSCSEANEKTIRAVCDKVNSFQGNNMGDETVLSEARCAISDIQNEVESAKDIQRSNSPFVETTCVRDILPDLANPSAAEFMLDIRTEYAKKLVESQERARKLREDLAVEEHRELELSRILKEVVSDPNTSSLQKFRPGREDIGTHSQFMESGKTSGRSSKDPTTNHAILANADSDCRWKFYESGETLKLLEGMKQYVGSFEKVSTSLTIESYEIRSPQNVLEEYDLRGSPESLLFDRILFKNRIQSGSMLLCGGGNSSMFSSFASGI